MPMYACIYIKLFKDEHYHKKKKKKTQKILILSESK